MKYYGFQYLTDRPAINGDTEGRYGSWIRFESKSAREQWAKGDTSREEVNTSDPELRSALRKLSKALEWGMTEEQALWEANFKDGE